jgi:DNA polymerase-3 subunit beta
MRVTISQTDLAALVARGVSSAPKNSPALIANNARLVAKNGVLSVSSCDFERMVEASAKCSVEKAGATTVDAIKLKQAVDRIARGAEVSMVLNEKRDFVMKAGRSRMTFHTMPAEDWPSLKEQVSGDCRFELSGADLVSLLGETVNAVAQPGTVMAGVFLHVREWSGRKALVAVATTGTVFLLSAIDMPKGADALPDNDGRPGIMLSPEFVNAALRIFRSAERISVAADENKVVLSTDSTRLTSSMLAGLYPDYDRIVSADTETCVTIDRNRALASVALLETFATDEQGHRLQCAGSDEGLVLAAGAASGDAVDVADAEIAGKVDPFGISSLYLKTVLGAFKSDTLLLRPDARNRRVMFASEAEPDKVGLVGMMAIPTDLATEPRHA